MRHKKCRSMTPILVQFDFFYFIEKSEERKKNFLRKKWVNFWYRIFFRFIILFFIFLKECNKVSWRLLKFLKEFPFYQNKFSEVNLSGKFYFYWSRKDMTEILYWLTKFPRDISLILFRETFLRKTWANFSKRIFVASFYNLKECDKITWCFF